ncbi:kinase-like domain-containing protein [Fennellomyces sp. T-0311]|nr:kinase-like domain-containing protein [Fennellomyces sp. T-0311]
MPPSTSMPRDHGRARNNNSTKRPMVDSRGIPVVQPSPSPRSQNRFRAIRIDDDAISNDEVRVCRASGDKHSLMDVYDASQHSTSSNLTRLFNRRPGSDISSGTKRRKRMDDSRDRKRPNNDQSKPSDDTQDPQNPPGHISTPPISQPRQQNMEADEDMHSPQMDTDDGSALSQLSDNDSQEPTQVAMGTDDRSQKESKPILSQRTDDDPQRTVKPALSLPPDIDSQKTLCASQEPVNDNTPSPAKAPVEKAGMTDRAEEKVEIRPEEASKEDTPAIGAKPATNSTDNGRENNSKLEAKPDETKKDAEEENSDEDKKRLIEENKKNAEEERKRAEEERKRAEEEKKRVEHEKMLADIAELNAKVKHLADSYKITRKIGEGTFSTVYEAVDLRRNIYQNELWQRQLLEGQRITNPKATATTGSLVALKRVYSTSSPTRLSSEIKILQELRGCPCVAPLITAFRHADEFFVVMPYIQSNDFKQIYRSLTIIEIKCYFRSLFTGLSHLHAHNYMHRDVKPNNFLYNRESRSGVLIDFGLAERISTPRPAPSGQQHLQPKKRLTSTPNATGAAAKSERPFLGNKENINTPPQVPGYFKNDSRQSIQANRAGTKGFRAPEILLRERYQTGAIDVWSAGVILLCVITGRYPFFLASDDADALIEVANLFGLDTLKDLARKKKLNLVTNLPLPPRTRPLDELCKRLNEETLMSWDEQNLKDGLDLLKKCLMLDSSERITAKEALDHPFLALDGGDDVPIAAG